MISQIKQYTSDVTLNIVNAIYLVKDWVLLQIGASIGTSTLMDDVLKWSIGITIVIFNIVRIIKISLELKENKKKNNDKD
jgi:hypothetical protein